MVWGATLTASACESQVLPARIKAWPPRVHTVVVEAGDDAAELIADCALRGIEGLAPLSKPGGLSAFPARQSPLAPAWPQH